MNEDPARPGTEAGASNAAKALEDDGVANDAAPVLALAVQAAIRLMPVETQPALHRALAATLDGRYRKSRGDAHAAARANYALVAAVNDAADAADAVAAAPAATTADARGMRMRHKALLRALSAMWEGRDRKAAASLMPILLGDAAGRLQRAIDDLLIPADRLWTD